jgi:hypothetical protein
MLSVNNFGNIESVCGGGFEIVQPGSAGDAVKRAVNLGLVECSAAPRRTSAQPCMPGRAGIAAARDDLWRRTTSVLSRAVQCFAHTPCECLAGAQQGRQITSRVRSHIAVFICLALCACFSMQTRSWGQWSEGAPAEHGAGSSVIFGWVDWPGMIVSIDRHSEVAPGYKSAQLRPGRHVIEYSNYVHDFGHVSGAMDLDLVASHEYEFRFATCYWCKPRRFAVWVEDTTIGAVAWGSRPDWPRWYL